MSPFVTATEAKWKYTTRMGRMGKNISTWFKMHDFWNTGFGKCVVHHPNLRRKFFSQTRYRGTTWNNHIEGPLSMTCFVFETHEVAIWGWIKDDQSPPSKFRWLDPRRFGRAVDQWQQWQSAHLEFSGSFRDQRRFLGPFKYLPVRCSMQCQTC